MTTLMETALIEMAQQNVALDQFTIELIERDMLHRCSRAALDRMCAFPVSAVGRLAISARARVNWRRVVQTAQLSTPVSRLRIQWNNGSPGMNMLRANYNDDFAAFAREVFGK